MPLEDLELEEGGGDEDEGEIIDWQLPLCFMKKRHKETITGMKHLAQTWRMKERVRIHLKLERLLYRVLILLFF